MRCQDEPGIFFLLKSSEPVSVELEQMLRMITIVLVMYISVESCLRDEAEQRRSSLPGDGRGKRVPVCSVAQKQACSCGAPLRATC